MIDVGIQDIVGLKVGNNNIVEAYQGINLIWAENNNPYIHLLFTTTKVEEYILSASNNLRSMVVECYIDGNLMPEPVTGFIQMVEPGEHTIDYLVTGDTLPQGCFNNCSAYYMGIPNGIKHLSRQCFINNGNASRIPVTVVLPSTLKTIGDMALSNNYGFYELKIPYGVETVGGGAFAGNRNLKELQLPDSITSIDDFAFEYCDSLTAITLPIGITSLGVKTFAEDTVLPDLTIPSGVTSIGDLCFASCETLTTMTILAPTPPTIPSDPDKDIFLGTPMSTIYVPAASVSAYEQAWGPMYPNVRFLPIT